MATPITKWQGFIAFIALVIAATLVAKIPIATLFKRAVIEVPFVLFAVLMPFFGTGEKFAIGPL